MSGQAPLFVSNFTNVYPAADKATKLLFHGVTGAIDEVSVDLAQLLGSHRVSRQPLPQGSIPDRELALLRNRGYLTALDRDSELSGYHDYVRELHARRTGQASPYAMLIPSYQCNLACPYCFQNKLREGGGPAARAVMSRTYVRELFELVMPSLYGERYDQLSITLYGGEPFLPQNAEAIDEIVGFTRSRGHQVNAISNGTFDESFLRFFHADEPGFVNSVQISLDGDRERHDRSRTSAAAGPTFDKILANIHRLGERGVGVSIRINVTREAQDSLPLLQAQLEESGVLRYDSVGAYTRAVHEIHTRDDASEFPEIMSQWTLHRSLEAFGIDRMSSPVNRVCSDVRRILQSKSGIKLNRTHYCMQNRPLAFIFDGLRDVYGCYDEAGYPRRAIGKVGEDSSVTFTPLYQTYLGRSLAEYEPCNSCSVGLTCGGGCPVQAMTANGTIFSSFCDSHKELLATAVREVAGRRAAKRREPAHIEDAPLA